MPELPEVAALAAFLDGRMAALPIRRVDVAALSVLKTADPPWPALAGRTVSGVDRLGKYLVIRTLPVAVGSDESPSGDGEPQLDLVIHLSRAGWIRWSEALSPTPPRPGGKGPIALRVHCGLPGEGFDLTEAGTQKRAAAWLVRDPAEIDRIAGLGPDVLDISRERFGALLAARNSRVKTVLTDQRVMAGIGNAYSDEICHTARLSPFALTASLDDATVDRLYTVLRTTLIEATQRLEDVGAGGLKAEKRTGLRFHGRTGQHCPVCGDIIREVSYADRSFQYCPTCQTGGKVLADRRMSRLLK
ncbi:putative DNA glycosylase [Gordonia hirsuta DSM 44140 = NBRC 16056]|uniref:Putative DNA glycosylase n=1 Tax=Gordonia hirsuta DSM 44140 = NBRC 16056 TaxID=1121927 RepID=L7LBS2_9ACTN|nr:DNA-formamidopyrimidine glycosylase family protein [Gordonia hirsuta]GAC57507.1 putative DNA glycosylase [Gordonia hirsuta DSM 44140 = NBRC 16056]